LPERASATKVKHLAKDLLISVTSFFRDPEAFQVLETQVIAPVVQAKDSDAPLRVWVPGCATGEELYSIAMLLLEQLTAAQKGCNLQIFASDVGEDALEIARQGTYPESIVAMSRRNGWRASSPGERPVVSGHQAASRSGRVSPRKTWSAIRRSRSWT